jgi:hypothetical protein
MSKKSRPDSPFEKEFINQDWYSLKDEESPESLESKGEGDSPTYIQVTWESHLEF